MLVRPIAPVWILVEDPPQDPLPVPDQQGISVWVPLRSSEALPINQESRPTTTTANLLPGLTEQGILLRGHWTQSFLIRVDYFRGTPSEVGLRVGVPLSPQLMLLAVFLKSVYSYNSSEKEGELRCCTDDSGYVCHGGGGYTCTPNTITCPT